MKKKSILFLLFIVNNIWFTPIFISLYAQSLSYTSYTTKDGLPSNTITALFQDKKGYLWIGTNNGLSRYDGVEFINYSTSRGLSNNWITAIAENNFNPGTIWLGTIASGVNKWKDSKLNSFILKDDPNFNMVNAITVDNKGTVWFTNYYEFLRLEKNNIIKITDPKAPKLPILIISDKNGKIWCAEKNFIYIYNPLSDSWKKFQLKLLRSAAITSLISDSENKMWVGTSDSKIIEISDTGVVRETKTNYGISYQLQDDGNGSLLIRDHNIFFTVSKKNLNDQKSLPFPKDEEMPMDVTSPFFIDRENNVWIGTWENGLLKISDLSPDLSKLVRQKV